MGCLNFHQYNALISDDAGGMVGHYQLYALQLQLGSVVPCVQAHANEEVCPRYGYVATSTGIGTTQYAGVQLLSHPSKLSRVLDTLEARIMSSEHAT